MRLHTERVVPALLALTAFAAGGRAQGSLIFEGKNHYNDWMRHGFQHNIKTGFKNNALIVCFLDDGAVYLVQDVPDPKKQAIQIGTRKGNGICEGSITFNGNADPYADVINEIIEKTGIPGGGVSTSEDSGAEPPAANAASPFVPAFLPLFRNLPFAPGYPDSALSAFVPTCDPANGVSFLFVHHLTDSLSVQQACTGKQLGIDIPVVSRPLQGVITPDQTMALVTSFDGAVNFIDLTTLKPAPALRTPGDNPSGIAISSDGSTAYVTSFTDSGGLLTIDIAGRKITNRLPLSFYPQSVFLSPDDSLAWVTFPFSDMVIVVDTLTGTVATTLYVTTPYSVAFNSTGTRAYISSRQANLVQVIDTTTFSIVKSVPVGGGPVQIRVGPDDAYGVVSNFDGSSVTVFDLDTFATTTISLPGQPLGMALVQ